ncbi:hypothetical protein HDV05_007904 [Chytridiales sp. JEL 0842]|nr:hypothetical protein HDV05_007904 [Chytridiales sp. JEL 0842]
MVEASENAESTAQGLLHDIKNALMQANHDVPDLRIDVITSTLHDTMPLFDDDNDNQTTSLRQRIILISHLNIMVYGLQASEFTVRRSDVSSGDRTYLYIEKVDSTGYSNITKGANILRSILKGFINYLTRTAPGGSISLHLFARAQPQYLFPHSAKNPAKRVLNDRQLIEWWMKTLLYINSENLQSSNAVDQQYGWWFVPGESEHSMSDIIRRSTSHLQLSFTFEWKWGFLFAKEGLPAKATYPRFPDDAKTKALKLVDKSVSQSDFKEILATTGECSSGRLAAFFGLCVSGRAGIEQSTSIREEMPVKASAGLEPKEFAQFFDTLMLQDFSSESVAQSSTTLLFNKMDCLTSGHEAIQIASAKKSSGTIYQAKPTTTVPVNNLQSFVKRKDPSKEATNIQSFVKKKEPTVAAVNNIQSFVKRKAHTAAVNGPVSKKPAV